jgi:hypothetical protein
VSRVKAGSSALSALPGAPVPATVSVGPQCSARPVVPPSRRWGVALAALVLLFGHWSREAAAATPDSWGEAEPDLAEAAPPVPPPAPSYASALTVAYTLAPLLAIPTGAALFELTGNDTVAVVGAGLAVVSVPVMTHVLYGEPGRGGVTAVLLPVFTLGGLAVGGVSGILIGTASCRDDSDCELAGGIGGAILGGLVGGVVGYIGYAVYDVSEHSSLKPTETSGSNLQVWAFPVSGARRDDRAGAARVAGAVVGATLTF